MANPSHLAKLQEGVETWNKWRQNNPKIKPDLSNANLNKVNLNKVNLSNVNLRNAYLSNVNLRNAYLSNVNLRNANLNNADLFSAYLNFAHLLSANLSEADLSEADLLSTNFSSANLRNAYLRAADLSNANLNNANLSNANLYASRVLNATFTCSNLTGACIADWQIGKSTQLDDVHCDYIFRTYEAEDKKFSGRLPIDPESTFAPGEFTRRFQILADASETIDITFTDGVDWQAFFQSFQELRQQYPAQNIDVQGMEEKGDAFIVRLKVEAEAAGAELEKLKGAIETTQKQLYSTQLSLSAAQGKIEVYREMMGVVKTLAGRPMGDLNFHGSVGNVAQTNQGKMQAVQHNYAAPEKQSLADAALEIQRLLKQLEETNPAATEAEQTAFVTAAIPLTLRQRAVGALQSGGKAAVEELLDNPYVNVAIAVIEGWQAAE
ncbi:MAG: pentapeptide repeat-containing protein [Cyanobacteria bacterium J06635_15]